MAGLQSNNAGLGMRFPQSALRNLRDLNLTIKTSVSIVFQQRAKRWLLAGDEGGGSLKDIAHYVGYAAPAHDGLKFSLPIQALIPNAIHRRVAGTSLVRFEMLRYGDSCDMAVQYIFLQPDVDNRRPIIRRERLFEGRSGVLTAGAVQPIFFDRSGEEIEFNPLLLDGIRAVTTGSFCLHCHHAHLLPVQPVEVESIITALRASRATSPVVEESAVAPRELKKKRGGTSRLEGNVKVMDLPKTKGA